MAQPLYVLEAVDVRRADESDSSRVLTINRLILPELKRKIANFAPGGTVGEVAFTLPQIDPIVPRFELKGVDPDALSSFGFAAGVRDKWVFAGAMRNKQGGASQPLRAVIQGTISTFTPDEFSVGDFFGCNYQLDEVVHYSLELNGTELWYWDFYEREGRANGQSWFNDVRLALGV